MKRTTIIQALSFKTGRDLVLINVLSVLLILVIILFPNAPVRIILGLPFVLFFTGYVSISALFPRKEELDIIERLAFSIGLSIAITPLIGLMLNYTPFGIRVYSIVFSLFSFILLVSVVAIYRRRAISAGDVFVPLAPDGNMRKFDAISVEESNEEVRHKIKSETRFAGIFRKIKLEYIALPLFLVISLFCYHQKYFSYIFLAISAVIGVLLFIVFNKYFTKDEEPILSFEMPDDKSHTFQLVTSSLFFVFFGLSFLTLLQGFYTKTVWYYVFISLCAGVIATEILFVKTKTQGSLNLIKSFLLILNITLSNQILFPYGIGSPDSGYQISRLVVPIINHGTLPAGSSGSYVNFPGHHIFVVMNSLIMGTDPRMTYFCIGSLVMSVVGLLFVFLIGRKFVSLKFGLFAALLYACADHLTLWTSHPCQMTFTYPLALMIFAALLYIYKERDWRFSAFFPILVTTMIFTHHFSAVVVFLILLSLGFIEISRRIKIPDYKFRFPGLAQIYVVILFAQWMYYSNTMGRFVGIIEAYKDAVTEEAATSVMTQTYYDTLPIKTLLLNEIGSSILILLAVVGFLYFFKHRSFFKNVVMASAITFIILIWIGIIIKEPYLLPHRMYAFLQEFALVFLASAAIMWILSNAKNIKSVRPALVIGVIICLSFFSLSSTIAGFETSPFVGDQAYWKIYDTPYDRYSSEWIQAYIPNGSNITNGPPIKEGYKPNAYIIDAENITDDYFIRFSKFDITIGFNYGRVVTGTSHIGRSNWIKLDEKAVYILNEHDRYYDNGMVDMYYK